MQEKHSEGSCHAPTGRPRSPTKNNNNLSFNALMPEIDVELKKEIQPIIKGENFRKKL